MLLALILYLLNDLKKCAVLFYLLYGTMVVHKQIVDKIPDCDLE